MKIVFHQFLLKISLLVNNQMYMSGINLTFTVAMVTQIAA